MRCSEVIEKLEQLSPLSFAEEWDNAGFLCGRRDKEIKRVHIAVDATDSVIEEAVHRQADLLLTHHPLIFKPLKRIVTEDFIGRRVYTLIRSDICYYAMHTNFDVMGMADAAADELGMRSRQVLDITYEDDIAKEGIGRVGKLPRIMTLQECAEYVKKVFNLETVQVFGEREQTIEKAAISPGSGSTVLQAAIRSGAEVLITGDIDHHMGLDCMAQGLSLIDAGHFGLEKIFVSNLSEFFRREMPEIQIYEAKEESPFHIV